MKPLRVALLDGPDGSGAAELAGALASAGHEAPRIRPGAVPGAEVVLLRRGFTSGLSRIPPTAIALARGGFHVAHAFSAVDAIAALPWRRMTGGPVVFTCTEVLDRASVADTRLRLWTLERAVHDAQATIAADERVRSSLERWFGVSPRVAAPGDARAYERLYRELLAASPDG